jgi:7-cyano-7-deazaguanine synthase in queuosine biosynthesis
VTEAVVHVAGRKDPLLIRINGRDPTFHLGTDKLEAQLLTEITPRYHDFLEIASAIFAADGSIIRGGQTREGMGSGWRRDFRFRIPVRDFSFWSRSEVSALLVDIVTFLTDDDFTFEFAPRDDDGLLEPYLDLDPVEAQYPADRVILFSGGLDSFSGALDVLANSNDRVLLVTHRSAQKVIPRQVDLGAYLAGRFPGRVKHLHLIARRKGRESTDTTQRSRTLLFTAIGAAVCQAFEATQINFFENGIVSHNLPISPQVVGTMATRTTHPLALLLLARLVDRLSDGRIEIRNPYEWLTKKEVVGRIRMNDAGKGALAMIDKAVSCTSVRDQDTLQTHCGACSQCLDRRFAMIGAGLEKFDPPERYATDVLNGARTSRHSRVIAVEWTRHAFGSAAFTDRVLMDRFGLEVARIAEGYPDLTMRDVITRMLRLHQLHGENVRGVLRSVLDVALEGSPALEPQSLVALLLFGGSAADEEANVLGKQRASPTFGIEDLEERDTVPDPDAPLTVSFFREVGDVPVIKVVGLCDIRHAPAHAAHRLKPFFDEDRADGLAPEAFRYTLSHKVWRDLSHTAFRQHVTRCRRQIAKAFEEVHGEKPSRSLLIQNRHGSGYRLDPTINVVARERLTDG